jgi:hypothetical protein
MLTVETPLLLRGHVLEFCDGQFPPLARILEIWPLLKEDDFAALDPEAGTRPSQNVARRFFS